MHMNPHHSKICCTICTYNTRRRESTFLHSSFFFFIFILCLRDVFRPHPYRRPQNRMLILFHPRRHIYTYTHCHMHIHKHISVQKYHCEIHGCAIYLFHIPYNRNKQLDTNRLCSRSVSRNQNDRQRAKHYFSVISSSKTRLSKIEFDKVMGIEWIKSLATSEILPTTWFDTKFALNSIEYWLYIQVLLACLLRSLLAVFIFLLYPCLGNYGWSNLYWFYHLFNIFDLSCIGGSVRFAYEWATLHAQQICQKLFICTWTLSCACEYTLEWTKSIANTPFALNWNRQQWHPPFTIAWSKWLINVNSHVN